MSDYNVRALEVHSLYAWDFPWIMKSLEFIEKNGMNALVLHRNDFIDQIVYPGKYFGADPDKHYETKFDRYNDIFRKLYKYTPTRRSGPAQRRSFFKRVLHEAAKRGIEVYIECKELYFPDVITELYPQLLNNGAICANNPFWWEFTRDKYTEFFSEFPQVAGIIVSPGTGESKVAINSNRCTCDYCKKATKEQWYSNVLYTMYDVISAAGRKLIVRDFVFDPSAQAEIASVMEKMPSDVALALKNTPHDYYPTYPDNPRIGNVGNHEQWIEFDCMGQYYGWGVGMADLTEDYRRRLAYAKERGASGAIFRTDWESLDAQSSFYTPNLINQYSGAALMLDGNACSEKIHRAFLENEGWFSPESTEAQKAEAASWYTKIMSQTWPITAKTPYVDDVVFSDSSLTPTSFEHAYWLAEEKNSLRDWDTSKWEVLYPTKENVLREIAEKNEAHAMIKSLEKECLSFRPAAILPEKFEYLCNCFFANRRYVEFFRAVVNAIVLTRYVLETKEDRTAPFYSEAVTMLSKAMKELAQEQELAQEFYDTTSFNPHIIYTLMDPDRIAALRRNLSGHIEKANISL